VYLLKQVASSNKKLLVVHVHSPVLAVVPYLAKFLGAKLTIVNTQHSIWRNFSWYQKLALRSLSRFSSAYIACSEQAQMSLPRRMKERLIRQDKLTAISNGVPTRNLAIISKKREQWLLGKDFREKTTTAVVARMCPVKNGKMLLRYVKELPELGHVKWYGTGPMKEALIRERHQLGLEDRVTFAGELARLDLYEALARTDFYLTVSLWEGLSVADIEAVAIGCFPLMSKISEREIIADQVGFNLLPPNKYDEWRQRIQGYLYKKPDQRAELAAQQSLRARECFSLDRMIARYVSVYRSVARPKARIEK
jgi:glycosyltransferase involved in cell wall biosynthesis